MSDRLVTERELEGIVRRLNELERRMGRVEVTEVPFTDIGASVYRTTNQTLTTGVETAVQFDNEEYDTAGFHDNAINNTRLTVPYTGRYLVVACLRWASNGVGVRYFYFRRNGLGTAITHVKGTDYRQAIVIPDIIIITSSAIFSLNAGDYVEVIAFQNSGGNLDLVAAGAAPNFQIHRLV